MKAMSKQRLAGYAGVSVKTLMSWCKPYMQELEQMGLKPRAKKKKTNIHIYVAVMIENLFKYRIFLTCRI